MRGLWADVEFLREVYDRVNPLARHTQFADYHGHGWNFRAIFRRDREGNLLDADGQIVPPDDPDVFRREGEGLFVAGRHQSGPRRPHDGHPRRARACNAPTATSRRDSHGNGFIYGEVANAVEIGCKDCHGTAREYANLRTSGADGAAARHQSRADPQRGRPPPLRMDRARRPAGADPALDRRSQPRMGGQPGPRQRRFQPAALRGDRRGGDAGALLQHPLGPRQADVAQSAPRPASFAFGDGVADSDLAHPDSEMACFTCHLQLDDELRRLPPADRGQLEPHHAAPL